MDESAASSWTRRIVDIVPGPMSYVDREERYLFANRCYEEWFGERRDRIVGRTVREVLGEAAYAVVRPRVQQALAGRFVVFETEVPYHRAGRRRVLARYVPDVDERGEVHGFYAVIQELEAHSNAMPEWQGLHQRLQAEQQERRGLAEELQDELGQRLSLLALGLHGLAEDAGTAARLRELQDLAGDAFTRLTSIGLRISPTVLYDVGPVAAAEWLAEQMSQTGLLKVHLCRAPELPQLGEAARTTLYQALQELLRNVAVHAGTYEARVRLVRRADRARLEVEDTGAGCEPDESRGYGLLRLRDDVRKLGGSFEITSRPGGGTCVAVELPLESEDTRP